MSLGDGTARKHSIVFEPPSCPGKLPGNPSYPNPSAFGQLGLELRPHCHKETDAPNEDSLFCPITSLLDVSSGVA